MKNEICNTSGHNWTCKQESGVLGEIAKFTPLSASQVELVARDAARAEEVCPGGAILCGTCETSLVPVVELRPTIDFQALKEGLEPGKDSS